jgi:hypothetical protein
MVGGPTANICGGPADNMMPNFVPRLRCTGCHSALAGGGIYADMTLSPLFLISVGGRAWSLDASLLSEILAE